MSTSTRYVFLADAVGSPDFLALFEGQGTFKNAVCAISRSEVTKAARLCDGSDPHSLVATFTRIGLSRLRDNPSVIAITPDTVELYDKSAIVVTNNDAIAAILQDQYHCKTTRFNKNLTPYTGFSYLQLSDAEIAAWGTNGYIAAPAYLEPGEFVIFTNDGNSSYGSVGRKQGRLIVPLNFRTVSPAGITPRSSWQLAMTEMLLDPSRPISVIGSRAGGGKTLLAVACALHRRAIGDIRHIIYIPPENKKPPVPGDAKQKIAPYVNGLRDALVVIKEASHRAAQPSVSSDPAAPRQDLQNLLAKFKEIGDAANSLDYAALTQTISALSSLVHQIRKQPDPVTSSELEKGIAILNGLIKPLSNAEGQLHSLRQGKLNVLFSDIRKSAKSAQRAITNILEPVTTAAKKPAIGLDIIEEFNIEIMDSVQLRSRSLDSTFVIVDEAQSLELPDISSLGSRASTRSVVAFIGDARQTYNLGDNDYLNGMLILTQTQRGRERSSVLTVPPTVRSERQNAADFVASLEDVTLTSIAASLLPTTTAPAI